MALSDEVAAHVLGELHTLTKNIDAAIERADAQIKTMSVLDQQLMRSCEEIKAATAAAEEASKASIAAVVAQGKAELEAHTQAMLLSVANHISDTTKVIIKTASSNLAASIQAEVKNGMEQATIANEAFAKSGSDFKTAVDDGINKLKIRLKEFDRALEMSVKKYVPLSWGWQLIAIGAAGAAGAVIAAVLLASGTIPISDTTPLAAEKAQVKSHYEKK